MPRPRAHLDENTVVDLMSGSADARTRASAHRHLRVCAVCRELVRLVFGAPAR